MAASAPIRPTALVTGASGGIGLALTLELAADGYDLVLVARSKQKLEKIRRQLKADYGVMAHVVAIDLADPAAPDRIFRALKKKMLEIDVLINNAGFTVYGPFVETDGSKEREMIQVNVTALTHLTKVLGRDMVKRGLGRILNVASTAAFQPGPLMAVYYASKAYVLSFSEALATEFAGTGVTVTTLCPGPTATGFAKRSSATHTSLFRGRVMNVATVARAGYRGLKRGQRLVIPGLRNKFFARATRLVPISLAASLARHAQRRF